jgi:hypothetical protein
MSNSSAVRRQPIRRRINAAEKPTASHQSAPVPDQLFETRHECCRIPRPPGVEVVFEEDSGGKSLAYSLIFSRHLHRIYCRLEDYLCRDAAMVAAGPDVIR